MEWVDTLLSHTWTAPTVVLVESVFIIFCFVKGWLLTPWQIKSLVDIQNLRIKELQEALTLTQAALKLEQDRNDVLAGQVRKLSVVGDAFDRTMNALPKKEDTP